MTREETLNRLQQVNDIINSMTDKELYDYMMKTSPSFRNTIKKIDSFIEECEKMDPSEIFDEYGNYKYPWEPKWTPTDASTTGGKPLSEQLLDLGVIDGDTVKPTPTEIDYLQSNFNSENKQKYNGEIDWVHHDSLTTEPSSQINGKIENNDPFGTKKEYVCDNKIRKEDVHLERIGNKAAEKPLTPAADKDDLEIGRENAKFKKAYITLSLDEIKDLNKTLQSYKRLLYKEIYRLSDSHYSPDLILERSKDLVELSNILPKVQNFLTLWESAYKGPEIAYSEYEWEPSEHLVTLFKSEEEPSEGSKEVEV